MGLFGIEQVKDFTMGSNGVIRFKGRVCILDDIGLKNIILEEGHKSCLRMHYDMSKMYHDGIFLVVRHKARWSSGCSHFPDLPKSKGGTLETKRDVLAVRNTRVEIG